MSRREAMTVDSPVFTEPAPMPIDPEWCVELTATAYVRAPSEAEARYHAEQIAEQIVLVQSARARGYSLDDVDVRDVARIVPDEDTQREGR